eukprot:9729156-Prorocentrum_lima.AAC.1
MEFVISKADQPENNITREPTEEGHARRHLGNSTECIKDPPVVVVARRWKREAPPDLLQWGIPGSGSGGARSLQW